MTQRRPLLPYLLVPALPLLLPLYSMRTGGEANWTASDFIIAYVLLAGAGFAYRMVTNRAGTFLYRGAAALAVFACLSLIWVNLAVGFIGSEDNPANLLYGGVLFVAALGAIVTRLDARGLAQTMFAAAGAQFLVPAIAYLVWRPNFDANVMKIFFLNGVWVLMFVVSGLLFKSAGRDAATVQ